MIAGRLKIVVAALILASPALASPALAEPVAVRATKGEEYGRLVFAWKQPVTYKVENTGETVVIRFGRPIEAALGPLSGTLGQYLTAVSAGPDGRSVILALKRRLDVFGYDSGRSVIVEIAELEGAAANAPPAPPAPPEQPAPAASPPKPVTTVAVPGSVTPAEPSVAKKLNPIGLRAGVHAAYTRLVFDWPKPVKYALKQAGNVVSVTFEKPADIQVSRLQARLPDRVGAIRSHAGKASTRVDFSVPKSATVRHFLSGPKVVVDIRSGFDAAAKTLPAEPQPQPQPQPEKAVAAVSESKPKVEPKVTAEAAKEQPKKPEVAPKTAVAGPPAKLEPKKPKTPEPEKAASTEHGKTPKAGAAKPPPSPTVSAKSEADRDQPIVRSGEPAVAVPVTATVTKIAPPEGGVSLRFDWPNPVAAAVFRRAGSVWVVFDKPGTIDTVPITVDPTNGFSNVEQVPSPRAMVLRMKVRSDGNPGIRRDGLSWILDFKKQNILTQTPINAEAELKPSGDSRLFLPVPEPADPIAIHDPVIGDNLVVVPVVPLGNGIAERYVYPQVALLPSIQGIVVRPFVDDLTVRPLRGGVELTAGGGLVMSAVSADLAAKSKLGGLKALSKIFKLEKWALTDLKDFNIRKQDLMGEIARGRGIDREKLRFNLARFFFANGFAAETLGVLARLNSVRPAIKNEAEFRLMRGGANFLMGRIADAADDVSNSVLDDNDEANFWRASVIAGSGDMIAAAPELRRTGAVTLGYPPALRIPMSMVVANASILLGDSQNVRTTVEVMNTSNPSAAQKGDIALLEGKVSELDGEEDEAIKKWEEAQLSPNRLASARATILRAELLLKLERTTPAQVIADMERLRYTWRGDELEFNLLRRLGDLYIRENAFRRGLTALKQAATFFRDRSEAPEVTQKMADVFAQLYLAGKADVMKPVTAIAVYEEFKELTPAGAKGDEMIRRLADRLAAVDLLDRAAGLLEGQVRFRLKGPLKASVGAQLAFVRMLGEDYEKAIEALDQTNEPGQPEITVSRRRHLRARALMGLNRKEEALVLLKEDKATDADLLRAELFWQGGDWANASQALRRIVKGSGAAKDKPLSPEQAINVLNYAIALTLSGNERGLGRVRRDFGAAFQNTDLKNAFAMVSAPVAFGLIDPNSVDAKVKLAENFRTFLSTYKDRLKNGGSIGITPRLETPPVAGDGNEDGAAEKKPAEDPVKDPVKDPAA